MSRVRKQVSKVKNISWWKKKTQELFNALIREKGFCEMCGSTTNQLQCSHILSVGACPTLRFDILNVCCHCSYCHRFRWHDNPLGGMEWFINKYPERYKYLQAVRNNYKKWTIPDLQQLQEHIKNKELDKLITFPS